MAKRIDVTKVVDDFNALKSEESKINYVKGLVYRHYVPFGEKYMILKGMLDKCIYTNELGNKFLNMAISKIDYTLAVTAMYTLIDAKKNSEGRTMSFDTYDMLMASGILPYILTEIGENEINEITSVNGTIIDTFNYENNSIVNYISAQLNNVENGFNGIIESAINIMKDENFINLVKNKVGKTLEK